VSTTDKSLLPPNHLIHESSPYLRQHAHNPVDWFPWGPVAFAKARAENKPIFLSIGYSTCHWCHVMAHESFENSEVAAILNQYFVSIKVDREERPDLDKIYMTATQATNGHGGWPMSVWLTHDLQPFFCGTYFPAERFQALLLKIHEVWGTHHADLVAKAGEITETLTQYVTINRMEETVLDPAPLQSGLAQFRASYDARFGGFDGAPKFPRPVVLNFLFRVGGQAMVLQTLRKMAEGGLFDQLGGGFHRYSVDERWLVSHFEKMLYDQAQLVSSYVNAYQVSGEAFFADIAARTCDYVLRDLTSPVGGFYSAEDADSEGVEGKFYVWTQSEIETLLGERAGVFCRAYAVDSAGNWEHGNNILHVVEAGNFAAERKILFTARAQRIRPHRDEKVITAWNGLIISALCHAVQAEIEVGQASRLSVVNGDRRDACPTSSRYLAAAQAAARHILGANSGTGVSPVRSAIPGNRTGETPVPLFLEHAFSAGKLTRTGQVSAQLDDYACFANALLDLYETDFDGSWLTQSIALTEIMLQQFYDSTDGGFFMTDGTDPSVILRVKDEYDGAEPSGNSIAVRLLLRLALVTDRADFREAAERTLTLFGPRMHSTAHAVPEMLCALDFALGKPKQIVIAGEPGAADTQALLRVVRGRYRPNQVVVLARDQSTPRPMINGKATAYVCVDRTCRLPTTDPGELAELI